MVVATGSKAALVLRRAPHSKVTASIHEAFSHSLAYAILRCAQDDSHGDSGRIFSTDAVSIRENFQMVAEVSGCHEGQCADRHGRAVRVTEVLC